MIILIRRYTFFGAFFNALINMFPLREVDLSLLSVASSFRNLPIDGDVVVTGEVGLTGEIRAVSYIEKRIAECKKMGFKKIVIPKNNYAAVKDTKGIEIIPVDNLRQAINLVLRG